MKWCLFSSSLTIGSCYESLDHCRNLCGLLQSQLLSSLDEYAPLFDVLESVMYAGPVVKGDRLLTATACFQMTHDTAQSAGKV